MTGEDSSPTGNQKRRYEVRTAATREQRRIAEIKANMKSWEVWADDIADDFLTSNWED